MEINRRKSFEEEDKTVLTRNNWVTLINVNASLSLSFPICEMGIIPSCGYYIYLRTRHKLLCALHGECSVGICEVNTEQLLCIFK